MLRHISKAQLQSSDKHVLQLLSGGRWQDVGWRIQNDEGTQSDGKIYCLQLNNILGAFLSQLIDY